jgi:hypothetical protein
MERPSLLKFQELALSTDQNRQGGISGVRFPLLGLFGEVGSLLAEVKKRQRDGLAYEDFREVLLEEFGDVLWYLSNVSSRAGASFNELEPFAVGAMEGEVNNRECGAAAGVEEFTVRLIHLAGVVGLLVNDFSNEGGSEHRPSLAERLPAVFSALADAAHSGGIDLREAAGRNLEKTRDRWPGANAVHTDLFDGGFEEDEQIPRKIEMVFQEKVVGGKSYVIQKCNGIKIGDRLTDNMTHDDGYRYHDIFHLSNAAILGWSPVIRALFKCKRKSNATIDEVEDGARAVVIEEGVSTWVFNYASRHNFFEGLSVLDYDLLKRIRILVRGFEVERCSLWEWEKAILQGYGVFRSVRVNRGGVVTADLIERTIAVR